MERLTIDEIIAHCERHTERYERTERREHFETEDMSSWNMKEYWEHRQVAEYLKELKQMKDKQEQGLLIELPCKVGDTVYLPWNYNGQIGIANLTVNKIVIVTGVMRVMTDFTTDDEGFFEKFNGGMFGFSDFGEIVFLTRSEAEEALTKMGGNDHEQNYQGNT